MAKIFIADEIGQHVAQEKLEALAQAMQFLREFQQQPCALCHLVRSSHFWENTGHDFFNDNLEYLEYEAKRRGK